jgi:hypothetical protein
MDAWPSLRRTVLAGSSRAARQRLSSFIENYEIALDRRLDGHPGPRGQPWEKAIRAQLAIARRHSDRGEVDAAWRSLNPATRWELEAADPRELLTRTEVLRLEAASGKLSAWRAEAIRELLRSEEIEERMATKLEDVRWRIAEAARIRDDDADNRYYRVALIRSQRGLLLPVLLVCIAIALGLAAAVDWNADLHDPPVGFVALIAVFGALGACLSAIQSLGHSTGRIPEHVASSLITITRPALGAAAALGVYVIAASGFLNISLRGDEAHLTILALAFASGFSERLVLSAVGAAAGRAKEKG